MKTFIQLLKWGAIAAAIAVIIYVLYQVIQAVKAGANAAQAARDAIAKAMKSAKDFVTDPLGAQSSIPKSGADMPPEMANRYAQIMSGRLDVGPNPNAPWWERKIFSLPSWLGGTKGTTQTLGSSQQSVNVDPINIKNLTPANQAGEVTARLMGMNGSVDGQANLATGTGNGLPPASVNVGPASPLTADITDVIALNYTAPGAGATASGATGGLNLAPPSGEPDYSQNQFLGQ